MEFIEYKELKGEWKALADKIVKILESKGISVVDNFDPNIPNICEIYLVKHRLGEELTVKLSLPELIATYVIVIKDGSVTTGTWYPYGSTFGFNLKPKYDSVEEFIKALEQLPDFRGKNYIVYDVLKCLNCGKTVEPDIDEYPEHCPYCGSNDLKFVTIKKELTEKEEKEEYEWYPDAPYWQPDF